MTALTLDLLTFGETMVSFRGDGPFRSGSSHTARLAGAESTVAIGCARLGHRAAWAGRVGADPFGEAVMRELRAEGVDLTWASTDPVRPTGLMFVEQRTADLARVLYHRRGSAGSAPDVADVLAALEAPPRVLHLTGITPALSTAARECVDVVAGAASKAGVTVTLDVNHRSRLWSQDEARAVLRRLLPYVTVVIASQDELPLVADGQESSAVASLLDQGVTVVAVKRGARGASVVTSGGSWHMPGRQVAAVDPIGAGDAFTAGLISGLLDGVDPEACLDRAIATAGFAVSTNGDWEGLPTRADLVLVEHSAGETTVR